MANINKSYIQILDDLKQKIKSAQIKAALSVNSQLILLYWEIGKTIIGQQAEQGWGAKVIERLSKDLQHSFPDLKGLFERNLKHMRKFAETYPDLEIVQQVVSQLPWGHNILLLSKLESNQESIWYANKIIENGWSRNVLVKSNVGCVNYA